MAGVVHSKRSTSGRKQWTLHDGPRLSLKRLRDQLASDGCPESQVVLAKQLLEEQCQYEGDKKENARLGVYWLIKASEQGNIEATGLLKACLESGKGITEQNYMDVKSCITMTQDEKIARKAAREMFASLSNGEEYITSEQLQRRMLAIDRNEKINLMEDALREEASNGDLVNNYEEQSSESDEDIDWSQRGDNNEKLTEDHLISAAIHYSHGQLPLVNRILCLSEPNLRGLDHIPMMHRPLLHPLLALQILYYKLIKFLGKLSISALFPLAKSDLQLILLMFLYSFVNTENVIYFFPLVLYYVTFFVMVLTTFQILQTKREFYDFRIWSGLFITYSGGSMDAEQAEYQFIRNNLKPCWHFFISLTINLVLYPLIAEQYLLQSELAVVAFCLTFMTLFGFMYRKRSKIIYDGLILFSFAINVLAKYPYETDPVVTQGWRFIDLKIPTFASYVVGNGIEFCINFRVLLYAFIPVLFMKISYRQRWRGTYKYFIPHCVTLSWLQIVIISSQGATMFGLLRSTLALVGFVLFLPLVGLTTIFLPAAALTRWLVTSNFVYTLSLFVIFAAIGFIVCSILAKTVYHRYTALFQIIFSAISFYFLLNSIIIEFKLTNSELAMQSDVKPLNYEHYHEFCHQRAWENENILATQIRCARLENLPVHWDGYVHDIRIASISNPYKYLIDKFPLILSQYLYCLYGEEVKDTCETQTCHYFYNAIRSYSRCTLDHYNVYTFKIVVRMQSGIWGNSEDLVLIATDYFKNFTLGLNVNDHVWFKGSLKNIFVDGENSSLRPHVLLNEIGCLACHNVELTEVKFAPQITRYDLRKLLNDVYMGLKFVINILFNPIVVFK
ncbi:Wolframin EF-hand domain [Popillia japonica]|uniref:Wolframin EF-hand domain n=1 Tax=Popillia japonica TaxID=7064 RepID=A0AAW1KI81_POPJA